ncbi:histidinol-phosphate transaminase [Francisellaceae bacterium]|nr:histidinol-phosphate transaminase [Francisellaceae bacterium]
MFSFEALIRKDLQSFAPYASARSEKLEGEVWLNANESPWDNSQKNALWNRYPEPQPKSLIKLLSKCYQVKEEELLVTRGSDECIDLLVRLFCEYQKDSVYACTPTFGMYRVAAALQGVDYAAFPLEAAKDFELEVGAFIQSVPASCKVVFLCSPNNPTGSSLSSSTVEAILEALRGRCVVVMDEAYIEFSDEGSVSSWVQTCDHLVVLRTLSKAYGLAGVRIGAMIAHPELIAWIKKILAPYPIAKPCVKVILEALTPEGLASVRSRKKVICEERERLYKVLKTLSIVHKVWSSAGNFLLIRFNQDIFKMCMKQGVVMRSMSKAFGDSHMIRLSIGTPDENNLVINMLELLSMAYGAV